jgi:hypothetical protein
MSTKCKVRHPATCGHSCRLRGKGTWLFFQLGISACQDLVTRSSGPGHSPHLRNNLTVSTCRRSHTIMIHGLELRCRKKNQQHINMTNTLLAPYLGRKCQAQADFRRLQGFILRQLGLAILVRPCPRHPIGTNHESRRIQLPIPGLAGLQEEPHSGSARELSRDHILDVTEIQ